MTKGPASEQETAGGVLRYWDCCPGEVERREPLILWASETVWCSWVSFVSLTGGVGWGGPQRRAAIQRHDDARAARAHRAGRQPHVGVYIIKKEN
jgi:cellulase/cellobiase CelA1